MYCTMMYVRIYVVCERPHIPMSPAMVYVCVVYIFIFEHPHVPVSPVGVFVVYIYIYIYICSGVYVCAVFKRPSTFIQSNKDATLKFCAPFIHDPDQKPLNRGNHNRPWLTVAGPTVDSGDGKTGYIC